MSTMTVQFLGSGDAFGSGGRLQTCLYVQSPRCTFLIDCGASALIAMRRFGVDPNSVDLILLSHLHGDHFGGLPFLFLDAQLISKRTTPLTVAGPPGTRQRLTDAMEVLFPGSSQVRQRFALDVIEMQPETPYVCAGLTIIPYQVEHACGAPPFALRIACQGKVLTYSGDTAWTEALIAAAQDADLLIAEAYFFDRQVKYHLDYQTLITHLPRLRPGRLILTHMSADMLARVGSLPYESAEDGMVVHV